jgi:hypothetical protein
VSTSHSLPLGVALFSAGVAGIGVRYGLFPLQLEISSVARGLLIGTLSTFVVLGFQTIRRARAEGAVVRPLRVGAAALGSAAVVLAIGLSLAPRGAASALTAEVTQGSRGEVDLEAVELPGLRVSLPAWSRAAFDENPMEGRIELADPTGLDRHIKLDWKLADAPPASFFAEIFVARGLDLQERQPLRVAGQDVERLYFADDETGKRVAVTYWSCAGDPRTFTLLSFLGMARHDLLRLHDRMLESVQCLELPEIAYTPTFPVLDDDGLERIEQPTSVGYVSPEGETYVFTAGSHDLGIITSFRGDADLRRTIVKGMELRPDPDAFAGPPAKVGPHERLVFTGRVTDPDGGAVFTMLLTAFTCDEQVFIAMVLPAAQQPTPEAIDRLGAARCIP